MSLQYDLKEAPDVRKTGEQQPLYPLIVTKGTIDGAEFIDRVHRFTGISRSLLSGAMEAFRNELRDLLANGWNMELEDTGYFSLSLQGPPVMKCTEVHAQSIKLKNVNFRAKSNFKKEVAQKMEPERVDSTRRPHHTALSPEECLRRVNEHFAQYPCLTRKDYSCLTGRKAKQAVDDLNRLIKQGVIERYGKGNQPSNIIRLYYLIPTSLISIKSRTTHNCGYFFQIQGVM